MINKLFSHLIAVAVVSGAFTFGLALPAAPGYAQAVPSADAQASVISPLPAKLGAATEAVRPFRVRVSQEALDGLRRRIAAMRWPEREAVTDASQGVQRATIQELARYWATDYNWRKAEAKLNTLPQFITEFDGLGIHFIHVRSKHQNALPLIVTHGWPGSVIEQLKIVDPAARISFSRG